MAVRTINGLALCAGVGALEFGLKLALPGYRSVGYVEREAFAAATLVERMEEQALDSAPVWDDLASFDGRPWRGRVDLISGGFPCQPFSAAGQKRGLDDERWLWPRIATIIDDVQPSVCFFENVPQLVKRGLPVILDDLAQLGFDAEWSRLSAAAVGAPHKRQRIWILAYRDGRRLALGGRQPGGGEAARHHADRQGGSPLADAGRPGRPEVAGRSHGDEGPDGRKPHPGHLADGRGEDVVHTEGGLWPPGPDDSEGWEQVIRAGGPQPSVRRVADGLAHRVDRLHAIGNGVVPLVAAHAFRSLALRVWGDMTW